MEQRHLRLGYHLVAFLDVLGQRDRFRALHLPETPEHAAEAAEVLRQTAGFVLDLRKIFGEQFTIFESALTGLKKHTSEPVRPKFAGFSDSFVASAPLRNDHSGLVPIITVFSVLSAAVAVMLTSLATGHPLRGGIDVGLATEIGPGEIYGAALERAYLLESKEAGYPRIVIGNELWHYLTVTLAHFQTQPTVESQPITAIVGKIMQMIAVDSDEMRILDYLGPITCEHASSGGIKEGMIKPVYDFVLKEQERINKTGDPKLIPRYRAFRNYVESRLNLWNVQVAKE
jgi:hypothetical protein